VTFASIGDVRVTVVSLGTVARKASILFPAVVVVTLAKAACDVPWALA